MAADRHRVGQLADSITQHVGEAAGDLGIEHGHVIVLIYTPDVPAGEPGATCIAATLSDDPEADAIDLDSDDALAGALSAHLAQVVEATGATSVVVARRPRPIGEG